MKFLIFLIFFSGNFSFSQKPYRGAEYRTIDEFLYGRFEVRMKKGQEKSREGEQKRRADKKRHKPY